MSTTRTTTHTPTPWRKAAVGDAIVTDCSGENVGREEARYYGGQLVAESMKRDDRDFVLRACNAHKQLVVALRDARVSVQANRDALYEGHYQPHTGDVDAEGRVAVDAEDALLSRIDAALAAAGAA